MIRRLSSKRMNSKKALIVTASSSCVSSRSLMKGSMSTVTNMSSTLEESDASDALPSSLEATTPEADIPKALTTTTTTATSSHHCTIVLTAEPCLLDPLIERQGVKDMLAALSKEETATMPDPNMPLRHFRAEKGNLQKAIRKIKDTLAWRKEFQVDKIIHCMDGCDGDGDDADDRGDEEFRSILLHENETGKMYSRGTDKDGRASLYMRPHYENTNNALHNMRHLVYQLERAVAITERASSRSNPPKSGKHLEKINLLIDFGGFRIRDSPPMSTSKWTIDILQNHYPERLHRAYILNPGFVFRVFIPMVRPFLDPVTKDKICLCSGTATTKRLVGRDYDLSTMEESAGGEEGDVKPFDSKTYLVDIPFDQPC